MIGQRAFSLDNGGGGTSNARCGEVGAGLPANPPRGPAFSNVGIQVGWKHEPTSSGLRPKFYDRWLKRARSRTWPRAGFLAPFLKPKTAAHQLEEKRRVQGDNRSSCLLERGRLQSQRLDLRKPQAAATNNCDLL